MQEQRFMGSAILLLFLGTVASRPEVTHIYPAWPANFTTSFYTPIDCMQSNVHLSRWTDRRGQLQFKVLSNQTTANYIARPPSTYLLLTDPPGALPDSLPSRNRFVQIVLGKQCQYTGIDTLMDQLPIGLPFMLGLSKPDSTFDSSCVGFHVCSNMSYVSTKPYNGTTVDMWSRISEVPFGQANLTVLSDSKTGVPLYAYTYHPGVPHSFVPPYSEETTTFDTVVENPKIDFDALLPSNWMRTCENLDVGVKSSATNIYSRSNGNGSTTVSLRFPCWENVTVTFYAFAGIARPGVQCSCIDCLEISPKFLTFTPKNYDKPQTVTFAYKKAGCADVAMNFKGSGWEHLSGEFLGTVFNCKSGSPGQPCD